MSNLSKGVAMAAVNREVTMEAVQVQLAELDGRQLTMVMDYIRGLVAADIFLNRT